MQRTPRAAAGRRWRSPRERSIAAALLATRPAGAGPRGRRARSNCDAPFPTRHPRRLPEPADALQRATAGSTRDCGWARGPVMIAGSRYTGAQTYEGTFPGPTLVICPRRRRPRAARQPHRDADEPPRPRPARLAARQARQRLPPPQPGRAARPTRTRCRRDHEPGAYWYHPHHHMFVAPQIFAGLSGAIIVRGGLDKLLAGVPQRLDDDPEHRAVRPQRAAPVPFRDHRVAAKGQRQRRAASDPGHRHPGRADERALHAAARQRRDQPDGEDPARRDPALADLQRQRQPHRRPAPARPEPAGARRGRQHAALDAPGGEPADRPRLAARGARPRRRARQLSAVGAAVRAVPRRRQARQDLEERRADAEPDGADGRLVRPAARTTATRAARSTRPSTCAASTSTARARSASTSASPTARRAAARAPARAGCTRRHARHAGAGAGSELRRAAGLRARAARPTS